jgi:tyrosyl-tRNA synthetase
MSEEQRRFNLIQRNTSEIITESDLKKILKEKDLRGYIGVEPSGLFHVGWIIWVEKLKDLMNAEVDMTFLTATWHAWINDKLGGKMEIIKDCASYLKHCLAALGVKTGRLTFIDAQEMVSDSNYWALVLRVAKQLTLARVRRAMTIMGRTKREASMDFSKLIYPAMQISDIYYLNLDFCLGGTDQRRAHVLARDVSSKLKIKKPIAIHTPLLIGLSGLRRMDVSEITQEDLLNFKMSKSKPETCIFIHDKREDVENKLLNAYCPPKQVEHNPLIEFNRTLLFSEKGFRLDIDRPRKYGGTIRVESFRELYLKYEAGEIHPLDLKKATAQALNQKLAPVRAYFANNSEARELYNKLAGSTISR